MLFLLMTMIYSHRTYWSLTGDRPNYREEEIENIFILYDLVGYKDIKDSDDDNIVFLPVLET